MVCLYHIHTIDMNVLRKVKVKDLKDKEISTPKAVAYPMFPRCPERYPKLVSKSDHLGNLPDTT